MIQRQRLPGASIYQLVLRLVFIETGIILTGMTVTGVFLYTRDLDWYHWIDWCDSTDARGDTQTYGQAGMLVLLIE